MLRLILPIALLGALPVAAQVQAPRPVEGPCIADGSPQNCVKNLACIGTQGRWFAGRAIGWNEGQLLGRNSDGMSCRGEWRIDRNGLGRSELTCKDGTTASVTADYQDYETGTAIGRGTTSAGERVISYSGAHVVEFLREDGVPVLPCGADGIELDGDGVPIS